jgi:hypothetical protein
MSAFIRFDNHALDIKSILPERNLMMRIQTRDVHRHFDSLYNLSLHNKSQRDAFSGRRDEEFN